ncbi:subtilisin-like protease sbt1.5 [Quercus suber]|uniref:Subtilisin-like protease sbt1.5 n=1 Tax=Quercus suber TaxID=58331 RepID=A0AAW0LB91_QUESU
MKFVLTRLGTEPAPQVAYFSAKGPNPISPGVLKPDIFWLQELMQVKKYYLASDYALSTSTATPHVAGFGALLKALYPEWSPAAIQSAIMTSAYAKDIIGAILKDQRTGLSATPLPFGAGYINPNKATDPGLIYDTSFQDYMEFL